MTSLGFEAAALGAAIAWALGGLIAAGPTKTLGGPRFTRLRLYWVSFALVVIATVLGRWGTLGLREVVLLAASGLIGLAIGDVALFTAFARLGPRRTGIIFATNAPMTAVLSALIFGERFSTRSLIGTVLVSLGVTAAVAWGTRAGQSHHWEDVKGNLVVGVGWGLLGALGQAVGVLLADPAFDGSADPWAGAAVRAVAGLVALMAMRRFFESKSDIPYPKKISWRLWGVILVSGTVAMVFGKTLVLIALQGGDPGIVSILVSTAPVLQLPLIWLFSRERPAAGAWLGAVLATIGTALIVL